MSESTRPVPGDPASRGPLRFTVHEFATLLGVSAETVRGQIERGEFLAIHEENGWIVYVDLPEEASPAAAGDPGPTAVESDPPLDEVLSVTHAVDARINNAADRSTALPFPVAIPVSPVDLTLLINLVSDLTKRNAELLESTATWRERVQHLETELQGVMVAAATADALPPSKGDESVESSEAENERAERMVAEAEVARLQAELREVRQLQHVLQNAFQDPAARTAAGWRNEPPEPAHVKPSWWRRMVGGS